MATEIELNGSVSLLTELVLHMTNKFRLVLSFEFTVGILETIPTPGPFDTISTD